MTREEVVSLVQHELDGWSAGTPAAVVDSEDVFELEEAIWAVFDSLDVPDERSEG
jgi:hypothetical protein